MIKATIKIGSINSQTKERHIFWDNAPSHFIDENEIQAVLSGASYNLWKTDPNNGKAIGQRLYQIINGSGGKLHSALADSYARGKPLFLYLELPSDLNSLPFELLWNEHPLLLNRNTHLIRRVNDRNRLKEELPQNRPLKLLFMACSPENSHNSVLSFEHEEEQIQQSTEKYPIDLFIEDSGNVAGLADKLFELNGADILHLTGHAGIDPKLGPVFNMEDETGALEKVTPEMLFEKLKDFPPKMLFLSGCHTGAGAESFAHAMVERGIPIVIGWGLAVSDLHATRMTAELYKYLSMGKDVGTAVSEARRAMENDYHPWPLLRIFADGTKPAPFISPGQTLRAITPRQILHKYLQETQVKVLEKGFIGRRRQIQQGVRILKGFVHNKYGILIHGTAGLGKSCLSGKLIERFPEKELVVFHGVLKEWDILQKLQSIFDKKGIDKGLAIIKAELEYEEKIKKLFREVFKEHPFIIYFDDFEQNLDRHKDTFQVKPEIINTIKPFLHALSWGEGKTNLIITSRYPFVLEAEGRNLPADNLEEIALMSFKDADLQKKKEGLSHINKSEYAPLYLQLGGGNPRLLEWLDIIAKNENEYDLADLKTKLSEEKEEFFQVYLAEIMAKTISSEFHSFLQKAAVFNLPVEETAFADLGVTTEFLNRGVSLTLLEKEELRGQSPVYWVTPIIREKMFDRLPPEEKIKNHAQAYSWYSRKIETDKKYDNHYLEQAVQHALASGMIREACRYAIPLANNMNALLLYKEGLFVLASVAEKITDAVIKEAIKEKDEGIAVLINNLGGHGIILARQKRRLGFITKP